MRTECSKPTAVQCKECGVNFSRLSIYRQHLQQFHNIETTTAQYEFASEEEFMAWKDALEMEVGVNYTSHTGNKKSVDSTKTIYYCRRSGVQKSSKSTHKHAEKSQGTSKMGYYCTSSIEAVRQNGCVQVTYYVEHHEHDINFHSLVHMTLPASVKDKIAAASMFGASSLRGRLEPDCPLSFLALAPRVHGVVDTCAERQMFGSSNHLCSLSLWK
ncbi:uncharacterized protein LOC126981136 [Eriocheir sinensis]|uniref:uncharacterized protein LOC126981136 n=1 Tax=Eriocheir sinensis TaxID=95602 RepID=UPI0021C57F20|nr:uncharacterized protein LOC126981136 [Eriocheir sinensis]